MLPIEGRPILTVAQMRAAEERAAPTPEAMCQLMEQAGQGVADAVRRLAAGAEALILCGPGNNGGDGYVAARLLREGGLPVRVAASGPPATDLARRARAGWAGPVETLDEAIPAPVMVDALFGAGLARSLDEQVAHALDFAQVHARLSIAVDLPSGVAADTGERIGPRPDYPGGDKGLAFDLTLAIGALKPAHLLHPAARECGEVRVVDLGLDLDREVSVLDRPLVRVPGPGAHKYNRGMVALVAGAMPGAAVLAASAAARAGAGYVLLVGSSTDRVPHAVVRRRWSPEALDDDRIGAVLIGPGLGRDETAREKLTVALATPRPLVLDGDALRLITVEQIAQRRAPTVLTPHEGEFAHLFGDWRESRIDRAMAAAGASRAVVVLKGANTVVAGPELTARVAPSALGWLSTAGTGDVLAGIVAARLASGETAVSAACAAVWLHADAARRAGPALIADDLPRHLPATIAGLL